MPAVVVVGCIEHCVSHFRQGQSHPPKPGLYSKTAPSGIMMTSGSAQAQCFQIPESEDFKPPKPPSAGTTMIRTEFWCMPYRDSKLILLLVFHATT